MRVPGSTTATNVAVLVLTYMYVYNALCRSVESSASLETACVAWSGDCGPPSDPLDSGVSGRTSSSSSCERRIVVNVSGLRFETLLSTVERFSRTLLGDAARRDRSVAIFVSC